MEVRGEEKIGVVNKGKKVRNRKRKGRWEQDEEKRGDVKRMRVPKIEVKRKELLWK